jgi:hypothetical protein
MPPGLDEVVSQRFFTLGITAFACNKTNNVPISPVVGTCSKLLQQRNAILPV